MRIPSMNCVPLVALLAASFATVGSAQQGPPKPPAEMSQIAFFEGTWSCKGKSFESPMGPAGPLTTTAVVRSDLGGHFHSGTIKGTMPNQPPFEGRFFETYDTGTKQFVMMWVDNMGGRSESRSSGWKGETMTYEGQGSMGGQPMKTRDVFTKTGATGMKHTWDMQVNGKWVPAGEETCTKK